VGRKKLRPGRNRRDAKIIFRIDIGTNEFVPGTSSLPLEINVDYVGHAPV
jgi:hypothetical protein